MKLAGDIGGTKTSLALIEKGSAGPLILREETFRSHDFTSFDELLDAFVGSEEVIEDLCLGIAGPVIDDACKTTNLPWNIEGDALRKRLQTQKVKLLNDLEAMALGMLELPHEDLVTLQEGDLKAAGHRAVIAAGTGLGECFLHWDGAVFRTMATEGGHADLASQNDLQDDLLRYLRGQFHPHVSIERILSGSGFGLLYDFIVATQRAPESMKVPNENVVGGVDRNAVISQLGLEKLDPACRLALELFVDFYGAEAGNLALKGLTRGGVFIGGGIAPKILPALRDGRFVEAFKAKGRFRPLLETLPVKVATNQRAPLIGAMHYWIRQEKT
jgi:glucokinase